MLPLLIALSTWLLTQLGGTDVLDGLAYDRSMRAVALLSPMPAHVLLIEMDARLELAESDALIDLLETVESLGPKHLGVLFPPNTVDQRLVAWVSEHPEVTFGRPYTSHPADTRRLQWGTLPEGHVRKLPFAVVGTPPTTGGVYRDQQGHYTIGGQPYPSLEAAIARNVVLNPGAIPEGRYGIAFRGGPGSLPHVPYETVVAGGLVSELVRGKVVLVGLRSPSNSFGLATPTTGHFEKMSALEYHGHSLNSLLAHRPIRHCGPMATLGVLIAAAGLSFLAYRWSGIRLTIFFTLLLFALDFGLATLLLGLGNLWIPCVPVAMVQGVSFLVGLAWRAGLSAAMVKQLIVELSARLKRRRLRDTVFLDEDPWTQVVSFLYQMLSLNRLIILELSPNSYHVREVQSLHCSLADIDERRRDYRRAPFSTALEQKRPLPLADNHPFLKRSDSPEQQYMVPLLFAGEVFGFLAVGVAREQLDNTHDFESNLHDFSDQVAELLHRRHGALAKRNTQNRLKQIFSGLSREDAYGELYGAAHSLERRLARLEDVFENSHTALAVYDLFGRSLMLNGRMRQIIEQEGLAAAATTTVDMVSALAGTGLDDSRRRLRRVVLEKENESFPVHLDNQKGTYLLSLRPLELEVSSQNGLSTRTGSLRMHGVLCELVDHTSIQERVHLQDAWTEHLGNTLRNDLVALEFAASLLTAEEEFPEGVQLLGTTIHGKIDRIMTALHECQVLLGDDDANESMQCSPFALSTALEQAVALLDTSLETRGIAVHLPHAQLSHSVCASPRTLVRVFRSILDLLVSDAKENSEIRWSAAEASSEVILAASCEGFGITPRRLRGILGESEEGLEPADAEQFRKLQEAIRTVRAWGGQMSICSEIGKGIVVETVLRTQTESAPPDMAAGRRAQDRADRFAEKSRLLLVDNDATLRALEAQTFQDAGHEVATAAHGAEAIDQVRRRTFDLIVVDSNVLEVDDYQLPAWLQAEARLEMPLIVLAHQNHPESVARAMAAGATQAVFKPVDLPQLLDTVESVLARKKDLTGAHALS